MSALKQSFLKYSNLHFPLLSILVSSMQGGIQVLAPCSYLHHYFASQFTVLSFTSMHISYISPAEYTALCKEKSISKEKQTQPKEAIASQTLQVISIAALLSSCFSPSCLSSWVETAHLAIKNKRFCLQRKTFLY